MQTRPDRKGGIKGWFLFARETPSCDAAFRQNSYDYLLLFLRYTSTDMEANGSHLLDFENWTLLLPYAQSRNKFLLQIFLFRLQFTFVGKRKEIFQKYKIRQFVHGLMCHYSGWVLCARVIQAEDFVKALLK